jgi:trehalose/maltose hydrolase-like predicted phosphorylase
MEIWKTIPNLENYEASTLGKIRSLKYLGVQGRIQELKQGKHKCGYFVVGLYYQGRQRIFSVHQLVAITFLDHTPQGNTFEIDHINGNKLDNRLENLRILSHRENLTVCWKRNLPTGVYLRKDKKKYFSRIYINGKDNYLGTFLTPEEASAAYQKALLNLALPTA